MIKKTKFKAIIGFIIIALMISSGSSTSTIKVVGSNTVFPIMEAAGARFNEMNPDVTVSIEGPGSGAGISALIDGQTDLAPMSRAPKNAEIEASKSKGIELNITTIALDALVVIVNKVNTINDLSIANITSIYSGNITNWSAFGGSGDITVIERDENSGTHDYFNDLFLGGNEVDPTAVYSHKQEASTSTLFKLIAEDENAIGYGGLAYMDDTVKAVSIEGVEANKANAADGSYAIARPLFIVFDEKTVSSLARELVDYILGPEGQWIINDVGYVALFEMATGLSELELGENQVPGFEFIAAFSSIILITIYKRRK